MKLKELLDRQKDMMWFRIEGAPYVGSLWSADYLNGDERTMRALAPYLGSNVINFWPEIFEDPESGEEAPILAIYTDSCVKAERPEPFKLRCSCCGEEMKGPFESQEDAERAACGTDWICVSPMYLCPKCQDDIANGTVKALFVRKMEEEEEETHD